MNYKFVLFLLLLPGFCLAQHLPANNACYTSVRNLIKQSSAASCAFEKVAPLNINNKGLQQGEAYFYKKREKNSIHYISQTYVAIQHQDTLYLNCEKLSIGSGFARVLSQGKYYVVLAATPQKKANDLDLKYEDATGIFEPKSDAVNVRQFMMYAVDAKTFKKTALTFAGMIQLTSAYPDLQLQFVKDAYNDQWSVILGYVQLLELLEQKK